MNNYDLIEVIGEGTYGIVYKCRDRRTNRIVAVKQFKNFQTNAYIRCTMLRELRVEQLLKGEPNVTQLLETFKQTNRLYLVMEYIPRNLLDVLEVHHSGLSEDSLIVLLYTLLLGIQSCHRNGIIHRDIKPENILVRDDGTASLCDFGFSRPVLQQSSLSPPPPQASKSTKITSNTSPRASDSCGATTAFSPVTNATTSTATSALLNDLVLDDHRCVMTDYVATRWYRSPEMLLGMPSYSYAVDMWAVGAIMAEAIDGEPLLPGKTELEQLALIQTRIGEFPAAYEAAVRKRNGGMLHLCCPNPLAIPQARSRVRLTNRDDGENNSDSAASDSNGDGDITISSYLNLRYGGRIQKSGMQLLARLLSVSADGRPTVEEALAHPYFAALRHAACFTSQCPLESEENKEVTEDESDAVERESSKADFSRQSTSPTLDDTATASNGSLPPLSPTVRASMVPFPSSASKHGSFLKISTDTNSNGNIQLFQRAKRSKNAGRPRAADTKPQAVNDTDSIATDPPSEVSLPNTHAGSAWQSASTTPRLAALPQLSGGPFPLLDRKDGPEPSTAVEDIKMECADADKGSNINDDSPPPRWMERQPTPDSNLPQRRHAASEGASGSTVTTETTKTSILADDTEALAKGVNSRVTTLLFKTKKGRAAADVVLGRRRSSQSEEGAGSGSGINGTSLASRFVHNTPTTATATAAAGATGAGFNPLASLCRRRSGDDTENYKTESGSQYNSPSLPSPGPSTNALPGNGVVKNKSCAVAQSNNFHLDKSDENYDDEAGDACGGGSLPRSGGRRQLSSENAQHRNANSYVVQRARKSKLEEHTSGKTRGSGKKSVQPGLRPPRRFSASQDDVAASITVHTPQSDKHCTASETKRLAAVPLTERPFTKKQQWGSSLPRRKAPSCHQMAQRPPAAATAVVVTPVTSRSRSVKKTARKNSNNCRAASPDNSAVTTTTTPKASKKSTRSVVDRSRFVSPKLPRVVKPLPPRERMTLLKEIESLDCPIETPSAVEVMLPLRSSTSVKRDNRESDEDEEHKNDSSNIGFSPAPYSQPEGLLGCVNVLPLTEDGDGLYMEDLGSDSLSRSPLLSDASPFGESSLATPPALTAFPASDGGVVAVNSHTSATASVAAAQGRPPRTDFDHPASTNNNNSTSNSTRTQPSLYFRAVRNAPVPLKLAAIYMAQGTTPLQPSSGRLRGASTSTDGTSSPSVNLAGASGTASTAAAAVAAMPSCTSTASLSLSSGRRPTPTLLRHPHAKVTASQPSSPSLPHDLTNGASTGGGAKSVLQPLSLSTGANSSSSRTPRDDSPRHPSTPSFLPFHRINIGSLSEKPPTPQVEGEGITTTAANLPHQRRLSATPVSVSISGEFAHAGSSAFCRRSQEQKLQPHTASTTAIVATPPTDTVDEVQTELLRETPLASPKSGSKGEGVCDTYMSTQSPPCSGTTATMSGHTTCGTSIVPQQSLNSELSLLVPLRESSNRAASVADLSRMRGAGLNAVPLTHQQHKPTREDSGDGEALLEGTRALRYPLPYSEGQGEPLGEDTPSTREVPPLALHPSQPVLGGVWVNVDPSRSGYGLHAVSSRKKSRLIL